MIPDSPKSVRMDAYHVLSHIRYKLVTYTPKSFLDFIRTNPWFDDLVSCKPAQLNGPEQNPIPNVV